MQSLEVAQSKSAKDTLAGTIRFSALTVTEIANCTSRARRLLSLKALEQAKSIEVKNEKLSLKCF